MGAFQWRRDEGYDPDPGGLAQTESEFQRDNAAIVRYALEFGRDRGSRAGEAVLMQTALDSLALLVDERDQAREERDFAVERGYAAQEKRVAAEADRDEWKRIAGLYREERDIVRIPKGQS